MKKLKRFVFLPAFSRAQRSIRNPQSTIRNHCHSAFRIPHSAFILALAFLLAASCGRFASNQATGDKSAARLASRAIKALGGQRALASTRYLSFEFMIQQANRVVLRRSHTWDRQTGRYRLEGVTPEGQPYVALFNINTRQGRVFLGSKMQPVADPAKALDEAYRNYLADTAWLLGTFHLTDQGVQLADAGQQVIAGRSYQVISAVTTGPAEGSMPGHQNWIFLDPDTYRPFAWSFTPPGSQDRVGYLFTSYQPVGKLTLPIRLDRAGSPWAIVFARLISLDNVTDNVFEAVAAPLIQKIEPLKPGQQAPSMIAP